MKRDAQQEERNEIRYHEGAAAVGRRLDGEPQEIAEADGVRQDAIESGKALGVEQARQTAAKTDISNLETALDAFEVDCGRFPSSEEGLGALVSVPLLYGGGQERGLRSGTVPTHQVAGMGRAFAIAANDITAWQAQAQSSGRPTTSSTAAPTDISSRILKRWPSRKARIKRRVALKTTQDTKTGRNEVPHTPTTSAI